jgi:hypothetical protein
MHSYQLFFVLASLIQAHVASFTLKASPTKAAADSLCVMKAENAESATSRRSFLDRLALAPLVAGLSVPINAAYASGGATAGGAYLLSAKQRYNERVKTSVGGLLAAGDALAAGSSKEAKEFFSSEDAGSWKDLTAAGYLLSNAFRRSSATAPDRYDNL